MTSESEALSSVISDIYDAALDPQAWPYAVQRTCDFVGGNQTTMFWQDAAEPGALVLYNYNDDPHYTRIYLETYAALNPLFPAAIFRPVGSVTTDNDLVPDEEMRETRFYKEWLKPQRLTGALVALVERDATRAAFLAVQWKDRPIDADERRRFTLLVPHFLRAVAIGRLFVKHRQTEAALTNTLNYVEAGVFLIGDDNRLMFTNERGRRMLDEAKLVREDAGQLKAVAADADRALAESLRAIVTGGDTTGKQGSAIALSNAADERWTAHVLPLADGARRRAGETYAAIAAVFVRSSSPVNKTPIETLATQYQLTANEGRRSHVTRQRARCHRGGARHIEGDGEDPLEPDLPEVPGPQPNRSDQADRGPLIQACDMPPIREAFSLPRNGIAFWPNLLFFGHLKADRTYPPTTMAGSRPI